MKLLTLLVILLCLITGCSQDVSVDTENTAEYADEFYYDDTEDLQVSDDQIQDVALAPMEEPEEEFVFSEDYRLYLKPDGSNVVDINFDEIIEQLDARDRAKLMAKEAEIPDITAEIPADVLDDDGFREITY